MVKKKTDIELLQNNYLKMDEIGREKLKDVSKKLSEVRKIVTEKNTENKELKN
jgi:hypothetical protein